MTRPLAAVLVAGLLVLAGCAGGTLDPGSDGSGAGGTAAPGTSGGDTGTVTFYLSDERNAIDEFEHLNVTVTKIGFERVEGDDGPEGEGEGRDDAADSDAAATPTGTGTAAGEATAAASTPNGTATGTIEGGNATATGGDENETTAAAANGTATPTPTESETATAAGAAAGGGDGDGDGDGDDRNDGRAGWVEYEVESRTVDLTELQGENATKLGKMQVPAGTYGTVFVYVSEVDATLKSGERVNVKLPSERLHINSKFAVGSGEEVDFVFDISVFKAGKSGKYVLKPVVSESGTGRPIEDVDERESEQERKGEREEQPAGAGDLDAEFLGRVAPGEDATVKVTRDGRPVANATVRVNGDAAGTTGDDGTLTVAVPEGAEELEVEIVAGDARAELERSFEAENGDEDGDGDGNETGD